MRSQPYPRFRVLIRPSHPVRYFTVRRNARRCSTCCRAAAGRPLRGSTTLRTPWSDSASSTAASPYPRSAVSVRGASPGPGLYLLDRGGQLRCVRWVPGQHVVVEHDTVVVVDNLPLVTELHRFTQPALRARPGLLVKQADYPGRSVRGDPADPQPLPDDPLGRRQQIRQIIHGAGQPASTPPGCGIAHFRRHRVQRPSPWPVAVSSAIGQ